mgnify:CR=1 FL=1
MRLEDQGALRRPLPAADHQHVVDEWLGASLLSSSHSGAALTPACSRSQTKDPATGGAGYPYLLSKAAIAHMTSLLAHDLIPLGVRVNQIAPGWVVTGMSAPGTVDEWGVSSKQG